MGKVIKIGKFQYNMLILHSWVNSNNLTNIPKNKLYVIMSILGTQNLRQIFNDFCIQENFNYIPVFLQKHNFCEFTIYSHKDDYFVLKNWV